MRHEDWGRIDEPFLAVGGIGSNLAALDAFAAVAGARPVVSTGDIVAYAARGAECVARVRHLGWRGIAGNVERNLASGAEDCGCGFVEGGACDRLSGGWWAHARATVPMDARGWMQGLPDLAVFAAGPRRWAVLHGGAEDAGRFLWPASPDGDFDSEIARLRARFGPIDGVIAGHSGLAFARRVGGVLWVNAGSLGLPPHDGRPQTRYAEIRDGEAVFHRLNYDPEPERAAMAAAGLVQGYRETLRSGIWPSEETLPPAHRRGIA